MKKAGNLPIHKGWADEDHCPVLWSHLLKRDDFTASVNPLLHTCFIMVWFICTILPLGREGSW